MLKSHNMDSATLYGACREMGVCKCGLCQDIDPKYTQTPKLKVERVITLPGKYPICSHPTIREASWGSVVCDDCGEVVDPNTPIATTEIKIDSKVHDLVITAAKNRGLTVNTLIKFAVKEYING